MAPLGVMPEERASSMTSRVGGIVGLKFAAISAHVLSLVAVINVAGDLRALCACVFLLGGLCDAFYTVGLAALANRVPKAQLAAATGCFVGFCGAGEIAGPLVAGVGLDMAGAGALILPFAVLMSAYGGVMLAWAHRPRRSRYRIGADRWTRSCSGRLKLRTLLNSLRSNAPPSKWTGCP